MLTGKEYLDMSSDDTKARELHNIICEYLDSLTLDTKDPKAKRMLLKLHELDCGPYFDTDIAVDAVSHMENVDGTTGAHWEFAEVEEEAKKRHIDRPADLYYAVNMLYSDLSNVLGKDLDKYIAVAQALYWNDPDMPEGKLFKQYVATI